MRPFSSNSALFNEKSNLFESGSSPWTTDEHGRSKWLKMDEPFDSKIFGKKSEFCPQLNQNEFKKMCQYWPKGRKLTCFKLWNSKPEWYWTNFTRSFFRINPAVFSKIFSSAISTFVAYMETILRPLSKLWFSNFLVGPFSENVGFFRSRPATFTSGADCELAYDS